MAAKSRIIRHKNSSSTPVHGRERQLQLLIEEIIEAHSLTPLVKNSYVLSRFWAWVSKIRLHPYVSVPIPRFMVRRDP